MYLSLSLSLSLYIICVYIYIYVCVCIYIYIHIHIKHITLYTRSIRKLRVRELRIADSKHLGSSLWTRELHPAKSIIYARVKNMLRIAPYFLVCELNVPLRAYEQITIARKPSPCKPAAEIALWYLIWRVESLCAQESFFFGE